MQDLFIIILSLAGCALAIWIIDAIATANRDAIRLPEVIRKSEERASKMSNVELLYKQFGSYVQKLFEGKNIIEESVLLNSLRADFPHYKDNYKELFYDLKHSSLITAASMSSNCFELGRSFQNLKLTHPDLIQFMKYICNDFEYSINITDDWEIFEAEIKSTKKIYEPYIYFAFGACSGNVIAKKIKVQNDSINLKSLYLYGKSYKMDYRKNALETIVIQHYCELNAKTDFRKQFGNWKLACIPF